jgi:hypothetical protein
MEKQFVDFNTIEQDVVYTAQSMQYIYGSTGYFYIIKIRKPDETVYYMNIREGSVYEKLDSVRTSTQKTRFTLTKKLVDISQDVSAPFIIISFDNDEVNLNDPSSQ